jgi:hypothetical protein
LTSSGQAEFQSWLEGDTGVLERKACKSEDGREKKRAGFYSHPSLTPAQLREGI